MTRQLSTICLVLQLCIQATFAQEIITPTSDVLPHTKKLELSKPLQEVMVHGISQFAERELKAAREKRTAPWLSAEDSDAAKEAARRRLREMIGAVDPLEAVQPFWYSVYQNGGPFIENHWYPDFSVHAVKWDVTEGVTGEAVAIESTPLEKKRRRAERPGLLKYPVVIYIGDSESEQLETSARLAKSGAEVFCATLINRSTEYSGHPDIRNTNMTHREYIYRLGFNLGRHIFGYETQRVLSLIPAVTEDVFVSHATGGPGPDGFENITKRRPIILIGSGEGAIIAQYVAALVPDKIDAVVLHGYFGPRENVWQEPIYRNVWKQLTEFGDAEIASLIAPTPLIIEAGKAPEISGPPEAKKGQAAIAAPGVIKSPELSAVKDEFERVKKYYTKAGHSEQLHLIENPEQVCGPETIAILNKTLGLKLKVPDQESLKELIVPEIDEEFLQAQQKRLVGELVRHTQMLLARSDKVRAKLWKDVDRSSVEAWEKQAPKYREMVHSSFIGKLEHVVSSWTDPTMSRKVIDEPTHVGYEIVLPMEVLVPSEEVDEFGAPLKIPNEDEPWSEKKPGLIAGGILLLPKDLKEGEQRPVVVCQHGLEGVPMDTITLDESQRAFRAYKGFATQLVKRGFIVYAPQNPYKGYDEFRVLQRKSNPLGRSLFSYIIPQHQQTLNWLVRLPYVDFDRIAFYGLSYGGKTAVRVPPLVTTEQHDLRNLDIPYRSGSFSMPYDHAQPGYCLSICSADFNEWIRKNASAEDRYSYIYTPEYEIFEWNMGHIANYAELSWLMAPRPFMVERGHDDGVAPDEWVGWEYAKVRRHYTKLGIEDQTEIEWFDGPHSINGDGTFKFLHKHLNWPERE